jgi:CDP-glucose 4,6-dehydratase
VNKAFWKGKRVFVTGHTGFKGSWLVLFLKDAGAIVGGYSKDVPTNPSIFELCKISEFLESDDRGDITEHEKLKKTLNSFKPEILFHLAAQSIVRLSYQDPFSTYNTNVMGTLSVLMAANECSSVSTIINITTDKCYENREWDRGYLELDHLGGHDPYSSSKACAEILSASIRDSFLVKNNKRMATVRAGNVIGGGDWAADRIIPDFMRAFQKKEKIQIRNPLAIRPWQHVMEPLDGYLNLAEKLYADNKYSGAWNFGPDDKDCQKVEYIISKLLRLIPEHKGFEVLGSVDAPHESQCLKLDCNKAKSLLNWYPKMDLETVLKLTSSWYQTYFSGGDLRSMTLEQIHAYQNTK